MASSGTMQHPSSFILQAFILPLFPLSPPAGRSFAYPRKPSPYSMDWASSVGGPASLTAGRPGGGVPRPARPTSALLTRLDQATARRTRCTRLPAAAGVSDRMAAGTSGRRAGRGRANSDGTCRHTGTPVRSRSKGPCRARCGWAPRGASRLRVRRWGCFALRLSRDIASSCCGCNWSGSFTRPIGHVGCRTQTLAAPSADGRQELFSDQGARRLAASGVAHRPAHGPPGTRGGAAAAFCPTPQPKRSLPVHSARPARAGGKASVEA